MGNPGYTSLEHLTEEIKKYNPSANLEMVEKAYNIAVKVHVGQVRASGEPFVTHPICVANILAEMKLDAESICAALLHDTVEDTKYTINDVKKNFGESVAVLVEGVTKLSKIQFESKEEQQIENLRKMFLAMAEDIRVVLIKLADRLHNMRTLKFVPEQKQREKAKETLEVYAPLAHRLGISKIKWELEDLSLRYIDPIGYYEIVDKVAQKRQERENFVNDIINIFNEKLKSLGIDARVEGRVKHFYSIYKKMYAQNKTMDELYDLFAVRIIVDTISDCYAVLGMVHELYKPIPLRFKDYIAMPKPNRYQSLHSTLVGPNGTPFEIQIRTWEMHNTAENGIAAHWKYKEGKKGTSDMDDKLVWMKQLLDIQNETGTPEDFMLGLKIDMYSDEAFVFTPKGDVVSLPLGSTVIDFAYAIHSAVGNKMVGAKVNGRIVTIDHQLKNGDIVEILTSENHTPSPDWLRIARTSQAKNKINAWFKRQNREENILKGKEIAERELKHTGLPVSLLSDKDIIQPLLDRYTLKTMDDMYSVLGYGGPNASKFLSKLKDVGRRKIDKENAVAPQLLISQTVTKPNNTGVVVEGIDNCLIRFSHCCSPVPGDEILGYVTRGRGVAVHRKDCINMANLMSQPEYAMRFIQVYWESALQSSYEALITMTANDRNSLLADITVAINDMKVPIRGFNARKSKTDLVLIELIVEIGDAEKLSKVITKLRSIEDVISVVRRRQ